MSARILLRIALVGVVLVGLAAAWRLTPLATLASPEQVIRWARACGDRWWAPALVLVAYTPACFVLFPRGLITLFAVLALGPLLGFVHAMLGILLAASCTYLIGRRLDRETVHRIAHGRLDRIAGELRERGLVAVIAFRLVPLGPFFLLGFVAGALRIRAWHFVLGSAVGILPGTLAMTLFTEQLQVALEDPRKVSYSMVGALVAGVAAATWLVRRWLLGASHSLRHANAGTEAPSDAPRQACSPRERTQR